MNLGISHASLLQANLEGLIDAVGTIPGASVNVAPHLYFEARRQGCSDMALRSLLTQAGTRVHAIDPLLRGLPGTPSPDTVPSGLTKYFIHGAEDCFSAAEALGAEALYVSHFLGAATDVAELIAAIDEISGRAASHGLSVAIEFIPGTGIPDLAAATRIAEQISSTPVGIVVDLWHLARTGGGIADIESLSPGRIHAVQMCDCSASAASLPPTIMAHRALPGNGDLPICDLVAAALGNSPGARLEIEVINPELQALPPRQAVTRMISAAHRSLDRLSI
jgi:sugar phosphate isomerase/epimerase